MPQTKARLDLRAAAAVVCYRNAEAALLRRDAHAHRRRVSVPDGVRDALLHDAVYRVLLVRRQAQILGLQIERDLGLRGRLHFGAQLRDSVGQLHALECVRPQCPHRAPHLVHALARGGRDAFHLLFRHLGRNLEHLYTGVCTGGDAGQRVTERVMDFPCQTVALARFRHAFALGSVGFQLLVHDREPVVRLLEFAVQAAYRRVFLGPLPNEHHHVHHE